MVFLVLDINSVAYFRSPCDTYLHAVRSQLVEVAVARSLADPLSTFPYLREVALIWYTFAQSLLAAGSYGGAWETVSSRMLYINLFLTVATTVEGVAKSAIFLPFRLLGGEQWVSDDIWAHHSRVAEAYANSVNGPYCVGEQVDFFSYFDEIGNCLNVCWNDLDEEWEKQEEVFSKVGLVATRSYLSLVWTIEYLVKGFLTPITWWALDLASREGGVVLSTRTRLSFTKEDIEIESDDLDDMVRRIGGAEDRYLLRIGGNDRVQVEVYAQRELFGEQNGMNGCTLLYQVDDLDDEKMGYTYLDVQVPRLASVLGELEELGVLADDMEISGI